MKGEIDVTANFSHIINYYSDYNKKSKNNKLRY